MHASSAHSSISAKDVSVNEQTAKAPWQPQQGPRELSGAQIVVESLIEEGCDTIFGYPGGVILPIYEVLPDYPQIRHLLVRHEQGACHMAEGYARTTGKAGVVLVTSGPGATNVVTGVADAYYDSTPLVVVTGNVPSHLLGNDAFQEADILSITRSCTKHNIIVRDVKDLAGAFKEAFHVATTGRPGPVLIDIPKDVINAKTEYDYASVELNIPGYVNDETYTTADIQQALDYLKDAKQPVILAGGGVNNALATEELKAFSERFRIPVGMTLMGLGSFPTSHECSLGFTGMHGHFWSNIAIANADVLFVIGSRLNDRQTGKSDRFARKAKIIHIDLDPVNINKNVDAGLGIQGEIKHVLNDFLSASDGKEHEYVEGMATRDAWFEQISFWKNRKTESPRHPNHLSPQYAIEQIFAHLPKDAFVTTEVGQHQMWAAQRYNLDRPRSWVTSGGLGTMGFGFPAAIGIQAAYPNATVVDIAGDGSFQMTLQELATCAVYKLPVKVCVINNAHLGMIRQWQGKMYGRESQAWMYSPDYIKLAESFGGVGFRVKHPDELAGVMEAALKIMDRPVIIDFVVDEKVDVYPWVPSGAGNDDMLTEKG